MILLVLLAGLGPAHAAETVPVPVTLVDLREADASTKLALACLQGIVNRGAERPVLYCVHTAQDRAWFDQVYAARGFKPEEKTPAEAIARFADRIKGEVLYDPAQPETINLATALAGLEDVLPVTAAARDASRKLVEDLTRFKDRREACHWAIESLLPRCNRAKLAVLKPEQVGLRDYLVAEKILPVGLNPGVKEEAELLRTLLGKLEPGALLFWGERIGSPVETRALFARDPGDAMPALARATAMRLVPGADVANLSFHARVPAYAPLRQYKRLVEHHLASYVTFLFSGNGNLDFGLGRMSTLWDDAARGYIPLGWELHPLLAELAPALLSYYYVDAWWAGVDQFVMAPSGASYLPPADPKAFEAFVAETNEAASRADLTAVSVIDVSASDHDRPWARLALQPAVRGFLAAGTSLGPTLSLGKPLIGETVHVTDVEKATEAILAAAQKQRFVLAVVDAEKVTPTDVVQIAARLGRGIRVVTPHYFLDLLAERVFLDTVGPTMALAKLTKVTFSPREPGPNDPITVKATISGGVIDARVKYNINGSPDFTEPLAKVGDDYVATIPPTLRGGKLTFKVRITDGLFRTSWSGECALDIKATDSDEDGLSDYHEELCGLDPKNKDTDGDGLFDANDSAPLVPFPRPKDVEGPIITAIVTAPRTPPAAGKPMALRALVFDPTGVKEVTVKVAAGERDLGRGEMKQIGSTQVYEYPLPTLVAGQTVTFTIGAVNGAGKASLVTESMPVTVGIRITSPPANTLIQKPTPIRIQTAGQVALVRVLINGFEVARLSKPPYEYVWNPAQYDAATHEVMVEAFDGEGMLLDADAVYLRVPPKRR
ncbi:MAG TPA: GxGYxYP family putative glycoside hydrolase [Armatimonadota bacterium]|nr:GxGYxYP family putative glycoside hydrolase [Armatimonadota bacterium]